MGEVMGGIGVLIGDGIKYINFALTPNSLMQLVLLTPDNKIENEM